MGSSIARVMSPRRWLIPGPAIALLVVAVFVVLADPQSGETLGALGLLVGQIAAAVLTYSRSRKLEPRERKAWRFYAAATLLAGLGVLAVAIWSLVIGEPSAFGPTDTFFLGGYVMLIVALVKLARIDSEGSDWVPTILDALVGGIALSALVWTAFLHELVADLMAPGWEFALGLAYPVLDIAIVVGVMILVIRRSHYHLDLRLVFLAVGMTFQVLSDFIYFSRGVGRTFAEAQPVWPFLLMATLFLLIAASLVDIVPVRREFPERGTPVWALMWPYLLAGALLATHVVRYRSVVIDGDDVFLLDSLIVIGAIIFLRQVLEIHRNRQRVEAQRSELVASVSHELRTPLTAIVGYLTLLDDSGDEFPEDARREMISEATGEARHMSRLVNDLVMLARGSSTHLPLEITEVPMSSIVTSALRNVDADGTRIDEELARDATVRVDADRVQQALTNLLSNAVRYGGDEILLDTKVEQRDLVIEVHDNGPGVPTRYQTNIWNRFERGAHRLNAAAPGLGIGLAIVKAVAVSHGGNAHYVDSERLGGACFTLVLPGCVAHDEPVTRPVEVPSQR